MKTRSSKPCGIQVCGMDFRGGFRLHSGRGYDRAGTAGSFCGVFLETETGLPQPRM